MIQLKAFTERNVITGKDICCFIQHYYVRIVEFLPQLIRIKANATFEWFTKMSKHDIYSDSTSQLANALFRSGCLKFGTFTIKSGVLSPYYIDLSWLLSSPSDFHCVTNIVADRIKQLMASQRIDKLASIELKGALLLPSIACQLNLPSIVVRKTAKNYGLAERIAGGTVTKGEHLLFFDDVVSKGTSKLEGIEPLERLGAKVKHIMVVVDREQGGKGTIENLGYKVHAISKITELVKHLTHCSCISKEQADSVLNYTRK
jgi:orotate phosphoribosyltransferase